MSFNKTFFINFIIAIFCFSAFCMDNFLGEMGFHNFESSSSDEEEMKKIAAKTGCQVPTILPVQPIFEKSFSISLAYSGEFNIEYGDITWLISEGDFESLKIKASQLGIDISQVEISNACGKRTVLQLILRELDVQYLLKEVSPALASYCLITDKKKHKSILSSLYRNNLEKKLKKTFSFNNESGIKFEAFFCFDNTAILIRPLQKLAAGAFKEVYDAKLCTLKNCDENFSFDGEIVSIQCPNIDDKEFDILKTLKSDYIIKAPIKILNNKIEGRNGKSSHEFIADKASGELGDYLKSLNIPQNDKHLKLIKFALHIALGLEYLHSLDIIHRDIKPANILIVNNIAKIADFGSFERCICGKAIKMPVGSAGNGITKQSPEARFADGDGMVENGFPLDMWAFGICIFELAAPNNQRPYFEKAEFEWSQFNAEHHQNLLCSQWYPATEEGKFLIGLCSKLLIIDKNQRMKASEAVGELKAFKN